MITLTAGAPAPASPAWWVGQEGQCPACKARVRLEEGDKVATHAERHPGGKTWVTVNCPTPGCGNAFTIERLSRPFGEQQPPPAPPPAPPADFTAVEAAWGIIANASGGDWEKQSDEWRDAAARWRDQYVFSEMRVDGPKLPELPPQSAPD